MASKLTWHFQSVPGWASSLMNAKWVKVMDPGDTNLFPFAKTIGRVYVPDNEGNAMIMCGAAGAGDWFDRCRPAYDRSPWVWAWEGPNEPPVMTALQRKMLCEFTCAWNFLMHQYHRRTVALCLSVGWPDIGKAAELADALEEADYMGLHEYSQPTMQTDQTWLCLRYKRTVAELQAAGARIPPILITETGIDGGVTNSNHDPVKPKKGWKTYTDRAGFMSQLKWYDGVLRQDKDVLAATIFTSGPNYDWTDFDFDEQLSIMLNEHIASNPPSVEEGPVTPSIIMPQPHLLQPIVGEVVVTQGFGEHDVDYSKYQLIGHNGLDLWQAGSPGILAAHQGQCWVYDEGETGYGKTVEVWYPSINQGAIFKTIYAHLSEFKVADKQLVTPGTLLGIMGHTGNATGPHLHFSIKLLKGVNPGYRNWIDPVPFMW